MRHALIDVQNQRVLCVGKVCKFSLRKDNKKPTILLVDIAVHTNDDGVVRLDHMWFTIGDRLYESDCNIGDRLCMEVTVKAYKKGNNHFDIKLKYPNNVIVL